MSPLAGLLAGVGQTEYAKRIERSDEALAAEATITAAEDAGIPTAAIDGIIAYPGHVSPDTLIATLGLPDVGFRTAINLGGASAVSGLKLASMAIEVGAARNVLLYRALKGNSGPRKHQRPSTGPGAQKKAHIELTCGLNTPAQRYSLLCRRFMHEYGLERAHLAEVALATRAHANLNPNAQMHDRGLTMQEYLNGRIIADPYTLFDCSLETDGACAVIVSADSDKRRGVKLLAVGEGHPPVPDDIPSRPQFLEIGLNRAAPRAWNQAGLGPDDMDAAMIYDCFTFEVLHQLHAAGFAQGDALVQLVESGGLRLGGRLPLNTHGGLLSEGHMAGLNHVIEAVRQLRGECTGRQIVDVRHIAVTGWGSLGDGSLAVLEAPRA